MEPTKQITPTLKQLIRVLKKEKKALLESDGIQIEKIVKQKELIVDSLSSIKGVPNESEKGLLREVKELQDNNLLLTKQAMAFNDNFIKAVGEIAQKTNATYSNKGNLKNQVDVGFINHSM
ncbi:MULTISPECIES: hypothetical protein [Vagococcus]|uniref:Flagellar protein FlgN n=1 Tax=Vagococcus fluvialis bH819 TaxID=1255619 RepID=A0A1X6WRC3_9ENTE|nr:MULTISPECIES: hypothetical protein [Vagococcus]SLM86911.1 hypothetical protein FM121_12490 [Vagococcus fluvialis bH819]HCM88632.1 hypothetical protein [Vagococcus sp.]